ncbi:hypothetical protein K435DRAFT_701081 [Dendrothele bispora CBS 962.96]|uniref:Peptidase A2 domain-containing protein n=1 Tax=Dendrothele bispora (strain CBS 962.96) TaxID=1314807 RepID=A0A4S8KQI8_DENBC|nr:hypothetical protein K435DRAFT_701081 [Dendrothele bispora CBS 962.96]
MNAPTPKWNKVPQTQRRPNRTFAENRCLASWMTVNGMKCFTLFDTGSTTDILSPEFAKIAKTRIFQLSNPVTLQLGTKGSKSKINYGCEAEFSLGNEETTISGKSYFDVANIDRYDLVIGCHFMRKHGIAVDLNTDSIRIKGKRIPTIPVEEEQQELIRRSSKRVIEENKGKERSSAMAEDRGGGHGDMKK